MKDQGHTLAKIRKAVSSHFNIPATGKRSVIGDGNRTQTYARARGVMVKVARMYGYSYKDIGEAAGYAQHAGASAADYRWASPMPYKGYDWKRDVDLVNLELNRRVKS